MPNPVKAITADVSIMTPHLGSIVADVMVVGGGNAGLCAAISAAEQGASVVLLERAPIEYRGGNSRHTRNFRCAHNAPLGKLTDNYSDDEFYDDLLKVTKGNTDESLARQVIGNSAECYEWMT